MHWFYMALAIIFEVTGTTSMKLAAGFTKPLPSALMAVSYALCFGFLTLALKRLEITVAYAVWSGVGMALISLIGLLIFRESFNPLKVFGLIAVVAGVVALNLAGGGH